MRGTNLVTGTITQILDEVTGEGAKGPWRKQQFILETEGQYPKQIALQVWGDNIDAFGITEGETITASIDIQSREYNGRWYTDVKAWRVDRPQQAEAVATPQEWDAPPVRELPF